MTRLHCVAITFFLILAAGCSPDGGIGGSSSHVFHQALDVQRGTAGVYNITNWGAREMDGEEGNRLVVRRDIGLDSSR